VRYLTGAEQTNNWLLATAERSPQGWSTLLRLHRHLAGDPRTVRWPHALAWSAPEAWTG
jgi:hypothetical protein